MKTITLVRAQQIASHWHGGQWSAFYSFCSSGEFADIHVLNYFRELEDCLHAHEYALRPYHLPKKDERELNSLKTFLLAMAKENGYIVQFKMHPLYGYLIPYLWEGSKEYVGKPLMYLR